MRATHLYISIAVITGKIIKYSPFKKEDMAIYIIY